jgi:hypothetical protein
MNSFINEFLCSPALERPNTIISFPLFDNSHPPLTDSLSSFVIEAWNRLLDPYSGHLPETLMGIMKYGSLVGYDGPDVFILSKNLKSADNIDIIANHLKNDLSLGRVSPIHELTTFFISSPLGLTSKQDGGFRRIHHLSHSSGRSVNDKIPYTGDLKYCTFQEVLDMIIKEGRHCIIIKRDILDAFRNVPLDFQI